MTADKRSVATDALETLGTVITDGDRDAIHLAVEPIEAAEKLFPGQHIGIVDGKATAKAGKALGIVDPFLDGPVFEGQKFWLVVYPRQITSLRHVWEHPDFNPSPASSKEASEKWLRDFCERSDCPEYETVIAVAAGQSTGDGHRKDEEYLHFNDRDAHGEIPPEFWNHVEIVTGKKFSTDERPSYFSCSC